MLKKIPVILFAYARPDHLRKTLECLRADNVPLIYAFSDGPAVPDKRQSVEEVRQILRKVDWCDIIVCEREENLGLGRSILAGVRDVFEKHDAAIVFEDDLICVPGTYKYFCAALERYKDDSRVMSIAGWTHPKVRPPIPDSEAYFDGRFACWGWATWRRAWMGMDQSAESLLKKCRLRFKDVNRYGTDIPAMARNEQSRNIWAVRFALLHISKGGLCFHPPYSLVLNCGFGEDATNTIERETWAMDKLQACPKIPSQWPECIEHPLMHLLWQSVYGTKEGWWQKVLIRLGLSGGNILKNKYSILNAVQRKLFRKFMTINRFSQSNKSSGSTRFWGYGMFSQYPDEVIWRYQFLEIFCDDCYGVHDLPANPRVIDGGANIGTFALMVKWARPDASIVCVEPDPANLRYLKKNLSQIDDNSITIIPSALGKRRGRTGLSEEVSDAIRTDPNADPVVDVLPLSELLLEHTDLLKLDVEGAELDVLKGAGDGLNNVKRVVVECHDYIGDYAPIPEIVSLLHRYGLKRIKIDSHRIIESSSDNLPIHCCLVHAWRAD